MSPTTYLKQAAAAVKALGGDTDSTLAEGQFHALVSVFGNVDNYGDVVLPGAFTNTLAEHEAAGDPIAVVWSHQWNDPFSHIGHVVKAWESPDGLEVIAQLDLDNPTAVQVHKLLKARRIRQFSFAYDVVDGGWGTRGEQEVYELRELKLNEVGPCLLGVNRETDLRDVKGQPPSRAETSPERKGDPGPAAQTKARDIVARRLTNENVEGEVR